MFRLVSSAPVQTDGEIVNIVIGKSPEPILSYSSKGILSSIGNNDTIRACDSDTIMIITQSAQNSTSLISNCQWYKDNLPMPGQINDSLILIGSNNQGMYYVEEDWPLCDGQSDTIHFEVDTYTGSLTASGLYYNPPKTITAVATGGTSYQWSADKPVFIDNVSNDSVEVALMSDSTSLFVNISYGPNCLFTDSLFLRDTSQVICDAYDTNFVDVFDTIAVFDTNFVDVFDTIAVFDTIYITQIDSVILTVTDTLIIDVSLISLNPLTFEYQVLVYPNPTNNFLNVDIPQNMIGQQYSLEIVNVIGQSMYGNFLNQQQLQINLNSFVFTGAYILQIKDSGGTVVNTKVIILK